LCPTLVVAAEYWIPLAAGAALRGEEGDTRRAEAGESAVRQRGSLPIVDDEGRNFFCGEEKC